MLFVVYQANRARHPVRHLVKLVVESFDQARQPYERRDTPAPAGSSPETMQGYGQHPLGPAQEAINRLVDFLPAQAGEAVLVSAETEAPEAEAPVEEPVATTEEIPTGDAGDPASADDDPLSPLAAMARANPALADWIIGRIEKRLAELGALAARARRPEKNSRPKTPRPLTDKKGKEKIGVRSDVSKQCEAAPLLDSHARMQLLEGSRARHGRRASLVPRKPDTGSCGHAGGCGRPPDEAPHG